MKARLLSILCILLISLGILAQTKTRSVSSWNYTVYEIADGQVVRTTKSTGEPNQEISVPYHRYNLLDGKLYLRGAAGGPKGLEYNHYFWLNEDGQTEYLGYEPTYITDVVYLAEGEDIPGMTLCDNDNMRIRSSNSAAAYAADGPVGFVTLPAGSYLLTAFIHDISRTPDSYWRFLADDKEIANLHCTIANIQELQSEIFTLTEQTTLYIPKCGDERSGIDLIYITKAVQKPPTVYYASPTGTDAEGTSRFAPGSLLPMVARLKAGDELVLLDGQYDLTDTWEIDLRGKSTAPITIRADENAKPIIDFRNQPYGKVGIVLRGEYIHLIGIDICYAGDAGIWNSGWNNILERLDVYGNCNAGIQNRDGGYNMVINCDSHDNFDYKHTRDGEPDYGGNADGFADKQGRDGYPANVYIGCRSWNNSDDGFDFYERKSGNKPTVLINCISYHNGPTTYDMSKHPRLNIDKEWFDNCGETLSAYKCYGNSSGYKIGGGGTKHDVEFYRCLAVGHRNNGFDQNDDAGKVKIINCTAYQNYTNYAFWFPYPCTLDIHNCISLEPTGDVNNHFFMDEAVIVTQSHNSWNDGFPVSASDFESLDVENFIIAPRNADGSLPETPLLQLKSTASDLIDKGIDYSASNFEGDIIANYISFNGSAPDLGCFEYSGKLSYTVNEVADGNIMRSTANVGTPEAEIVVPYRRYNVHKGKLYMKDASGGPKGKEYNHYFTLTENNQVETINYEQTDVQDVVFLAEGEDIPGMTLCNNDNMRVRSSNSLAAYPANGPVGFVTLPVGSYRLTAFIHSSYKYPDSYWSFLAGDKEIANLHCTVVNIQELQSEIFTLNEKTTLYIPQCGDDRSGIDLLYITKEKYVEPVTITADNKTMNYGDDVPSLTYKSSGATLEGIPKLSTTATSSSPVGTYPIKVEQGTVSNGNVIYVDGTLTIEKAALTVGVQDVTITEGDAIPFFTLTYSGFRNGDTESNAFTTKPTAKTTATSSSTAGTYSITVSGGSAKNYALTYKQGTLTIEPAAGIESVYADCQGNVVIYNVNGQKLSKPRKGINIINGKKVVMK